jgi:hypothetical protein
MPFKRPRLTKREEAAAPGSAPAPAAPQPAKPKGISTRELQKVLGASYSAPTGGGGGFTPTAGGGRAGGITTKELGKVLTGGGAAEHGSVESTRVTSYPMDQDMSALPVKAGTRSGPRVTSYRIPLRKAAHNNVYDTIT